MTISHEKKLIFIHIPKNAGTSIIESMNCKDNFFIDKHISEYKKYYKNYWNNYTKFTVIRDPVSRFISAYKFARMNESGWFSSTNQEGLKKHHHYDICNKLDINEYVEYIFKNPQDLNRWVVPQSWLIANEDNEIKDIDYFVRYEFLSEDLKKISLTNIKKLNSSTINDKNLIKLTKKSKYLLSKIYDIDYKNFHYKKPTQLLLKYF